MVTPVRTGRVRPNRINTNQEQKKEVKMPEKTRTIFAEHSKTINLGDNNFIKIGFSITEEHPISEDIAEVMDNMYNTMTTKIDEKMEEYDEPESLPNEPESPPDGNYEDVSEEQISDDFSEEPQEPENDDQISETDIRKMKKAELLKFIKEEQLTVDPKKYSKIADFKEAVIDEFFGPIEVNEESDDKEDNPDDPWSDGDWED